MQIINIHQAKINISKLIEKALHGEDIIITKAGKFVLKLVVIKNKFKLRNQGLLKGKINIPDNFDDDNPMINKLFYSE